MARSLTRYDVWLANLDPTVGVEIAKLRPVVLVGQQSAIKAFGTVTVVPLTSTQRSLPTRVPCRFAGVDGDLVADQIRTLDKSRLVRQLGKIGPLEAERLAKVLVEYLKYSG